MSKIQDLEREMQAQEGAIKFHEDAVQRLCLQNNATRNELQKLKDEEILPGSTWVNKKDHSTTAVVTRGGRDIEFTIISGASLRATWSSEEWFRDSYQRCDRSLVEARLFPIGQLVGSIKFLWEK